MLEIAGSLWAAVGLTVLVAVSSITWENMFKTQPLWKVLVIFFLLGPVSWVAIGLVYCMVWYQKHRFGKPDPQDDIVTFHNMPRMPDWENDRGFDDPQRYRKD